jgi:membrane protein YqaA with SNARE-associated domain
MTFAAVALGSLLGSFLGNVSVFWVLGLMAKRAERKQLEQLKKLQDGYLEMAQRERERLEKYAQMES